MNEIISWKPFLARFVSYDGFHQITVKFICPFCGCHNCDRRTKLTHNRLNDRHFFQGHFRCMNCGAEKDNNDEFFHYYNDCFISLSEVIVEQLCLF